MVLFARNAQIEFSFLLFRLQPYAKDMPEIQIAKKKWPETGQKNMILAEDINRTAAPLDRVNVNTLRQRVLREEGVVSATSVANTDLTQIEADANKAITQAAKEQIAREFDVLMEVEERKAKQRQATSTGGTQRHSYK